MTGRRVAVFVLVVLLPVLVAVILHQLLFARVTAPPPADLGGGTMFDRIADRYDTINRVLSIGMDRSWREEMVRIVMDDTYFNENANDENKQTKKKSFLDVATGTADVALLLAKAAVIRSSSSSSSSVDTPSVAVQPTVTGVDPSERMLDVGRNKVKQQNLQETVTLQQADARDLSILRRRRPELFDAATMAFGIRNVVASDRTAAVCEIHSVLKHGAAFCVMEFSEPAGTGWPSKLAAAFIRYAVPAAGAVLSGAPAEYWHLQASIREFPSPQQFGQFLQEAPCRTGRFQLKEIRNLNFGSVQIYVLTAVRSDTTNNERHKQDDDEEEKVTKEVQEQQEEDQEQEKEELEQEEQEEEQEQEDQEDQKQEDNQSDKQEKEVEEEEDL